jgi:hypothetical protein
LTEEPGRASEKRKKWKHGEGERERREREPERRQQGTHYKARGERFIMDDSAEYVDRIRAGRTKENRMRKY